MDIQPAERLKESYDRMDDVRRQAELAPCGNFSVVYRCMCDYHDIDFMEDVAWVSFVFISACDFCLFSYIFWDLFLCLCALSGSYTVKVLYVNHSSI